LLIKFCLLCYSSGDVVSGYNLLGSVMQVEPSTVSKRRWARLCLLFLL